MSTLKAALTVALFVAGIALGVAAFLFASQRAPGPSYPSVSFVPEPPAAAEVVAAIARDDAGTLANLLNETRLDELSTAMSPVIEVTDVTFVRAVPDGKVVYASYLVKGGTAQGENRASGFTLVIGGGRVLKVY